MARLEREYDRVAACLKAMRVLGTNAAAVEEPSATKAEANMVTLITDAHNVRGLRRFVGGRGTDDRRLGHVFRQDSSTLTQTRDCEI